MFWGFMKIKLLLLVVFFSGCAGLSTHKPEFDPVEISLIPFELALKGVNDAARKSRSRYPSSVDHCAFSHKGVILQKARGYYNEVFTYESKSAGWSASTRAGVHEIVISNNGIITEYWCVIRVVETDDDLLRLLGFLERLGLKRNG